MILKHWEQIETTLQAYYASSTFISIYTGVFGSSCTAKTLVGDIITVVMCLVFYNDVLALKLMDIEQLLLLLSLLQKRKIRKQGLYQISQL